MIDDPQAGAQALAKSMALANAKAQAHAQEHAQAARRELMRWILLQTTDLWRPAAATLRSLVVVVQGEFPDATELEVRRHLDYLEERTLIAVHTDPLGQVRVELRRYGIDVVEYTVPVEPGIGRPARG